MPSRPQSSEARAQRAEAIAREVKARRDRGEAVDPQNVIAAHPELMPELAEALERSLGAISLTTDDLTATSSGAGQDEGQTAAPMPAADAFPGYWVRRTIGRGGQGVVYEAIQHATNRHVGIKVLLFGIHAPETARRRFGREIELAASLEHPNLVTVFHAGTTKEGQPYYVMDYVPGRPLHEYVQQERLSLRQALEVFVRVCEAVGHAHEHGIIHRDLKPSNVLVSAHGEPKILDFGLARWSTGPASLDLTHTRTLAGTLPYLSPEQARGRADRVTARSDVYSLGVVLYQVLTGHLPYPLSDQIDVMIRTIVEAVPQPPRRAWDPQRGVTRSDDKGNAGRCPIDRDLETIIFTALQKEPQRRYASATELARDLRRYLQGEPVATRRDSAAYLAAMQARRVMRRHPVAALLVGLAAIVLFTQIIVSRLVFTWTPLNHAYEALLSPLATAAPNRFRSVRVIAWPQPDEVAAFAQAKGLAGVSADNIVSWRALHGVLMERLAESGLGALVWDVRFAGETPFDEEFVRGAESLRKRGVDVVVAETSWRAPPSGPVTSRVIRPHVRVGVTSFHPKRIWSLDLTVTPEGEETLESLALAGLAAYRQPGAEPFVTVAPRPGMIRIKYRRQDPRTGVQQWLDRVDTIRVTMIRPLKADDARFGLRTGDWIGQYAIVVPPESVLNDATVRYADVLGADAEQLRRWFTGRLVVVGDVVRDLHGPEGHRIAGCYAHATGIEALLRNEPIRMPGSTHRWLIVMAAACLGSAGAQDRPRRTAVRWMLLVAMLALTFVICVGVYRAAHYLVNPAMPGAALLAGWGWAALVRRQQAPPSA